MDKPDRVKAAEIVRDAGGEIVGRTRLQKVAYLLEIVGLGGGFDFTYHHYGPYSDDLAYAMKLATAFEDVEEVVESTNWGGKYSIFRFKGSPAKSESSMRTIFAERASRINAVELELAATAAYLKIVEDSEDPWGSTAALKPEKAQDDRIEKAKIAYRDLMSLQVPRALPAIV